MATVAILGITIGGKYRLRCRPGNTNNLRKDLEELIIDSSQGVEVIDLGELITDKLVEFYEQYEQLGIAAKHIITDSEADITLVVGGNHAGALPLYFLDGNVIRADAHGDAFAGKIASDKRSNDFVYGGNYMFFVDIKGLKNENEITNVGISVGPSRVTYKGGIIGARLSVDDLLDHKAPKNVGLVDIDMDVFDPSYTLPYTFERSNLRAEDLARVIGKSKPRIVGMFECVAEGGIIYQDIVSNYPDVFEPICKAVGDVAIARNPGSPQLYPAANH